MTFLYVYGKTSFHKNGFLPDDMSKNTASITASHSMECMVSLKLTVMCIFYKNFTRVKGITNINLVHVHVISINYIVWNARTAL